MTLRTLRIFISSPGDVVEERLIARRVIRRLDAQFRGTVDLETVVWEHEPLLATASFQEQLVRPSETDVVIALLWSRLGTNLPAHIRRADGTTYASGTEFEFEDAVTAHRQTGKPEILAYRKTAPVPVPSDTTLLEEHLRQHKLLAGFLSRWFVDGADGSLRRAFHPFESAADFEELLEIHLLRLIEAQLPPGMKADRRATWRQGSPFRGLATFEAEHAPVFFGRTAAVTQVLTKLRRQVDRGRAFLLIVGPSGVGKSSLVRAGVLPLLTQPGVIGEPHPWRSAVMRAADGEGDLQRALDLALGQATAVPGWSAEVSTVAEAWTARLVQSLDATAPGAHLALVIDQFEEVLNDKRIAIAARDAWLLRLTALAHSGRVVVIATLRSDVYPQLAELPALVALKEGDGQLDLLPPDPREIGQIIRLPALAAGLSFESRADRTERLDETIRDAAARNPGALPLLQFLLDGLYQRRSKENVLTFRAYEELGGVEGALAGRAEAVYQGASPDAQASLPAVLRELVTLGSDDEGRAMRRVASREAFSTPAANEILDALIEARLLVSSLDGGGRPVVSLAHEALLEFWPRLRQWREEDRELLLMHNRLASAARLWDEQRRGADFLLAGGKPTADAHALVASGMRLTATEAAFIAASERRNRVGRRLRIGAIASLAVLSVAAALAAWRATVESDRARTQATTAQMTTEFMSSMFKVANPKENRGDAITVREMLDRGVQQIETGLVDQQAVRATLLRAMGEAYNGLGLYPRAQSLLTQALDSAAHGGEPATVLRTTLALAANRYLDGDFERSRQLYQEALQNSQAMFGERHAAVSEALVGLGDNLLELGKPDEAEAAYRRALAIDLALHGERHADTARTMTSLAQLMYFQSRFADAEQMFRRTLAIHRGLHGERHASVAAGLNDLGSLLFQTGRYAEAADAWREALPLFRQIYGERHHEVATILNNVGRVQLLMGNLAEAAAHLEPALAMDRELLQQEHEDLILPLNSVAMLHLAQGRNRSAEQLLTEAMRLAAQRKHWMSHQILANQADLLQRQGRGNDARIALAEARKGLLAAYGEPIKPEEAWRQAVLDVIEAALLADAGQAGDAAALLRPAMTTLRQRFGPDGYYLGAAARTMRRLGEHAALVR